jgi:transposase
MSPGGGSGWRTVRMDTMRTIIDGAGRRLDVVEAGRRRRFSHAFKLAVVEESSEAGAVVTKIARRHGVRPSQIHDWRKLAGVSRAAQIRPVRSKSSSPSSQQPSSARTSGFRPSTSKTMPPTSRAGSWR